MCDQEHHSTRRNGSACLSNELYRILKFGLALGYVEQPLINDTTIFVLSTDSRMGACRVHSSVGRRLRRLAV